MGELANYVLAQNVQKISVDIWCHCFVYFQLHLCRVNVKSIVMTKVRLLRIQCLSAMG